MLESQIISIFFCSYVLGLFLHDLSGQTTWWSCSEKLHIRNEHIAYPERDVVYALLSMSAILSVLLADQQFSSFSWASVDFHFLPGDSYRLGNFTVATPCIEYRYDKDEDAEVPFRKDIFDVLSCLRFTLFENDAFGKDKGIY